MGTTNQKTCCPGQMRRLGYTSKWPIPNSLMLKCWLVEHFIVNSTCVFGLNSQLIILSILITIVINVNTTRRGKILNMDTQILL